STALTSSASPATSGQSVTFTATISPTSPGSGTPTGTVTFYDGSATLGTGSVSGGIATFSVSSLSVQTHSIKAVYGGDPDFKTSTSAILSQVSQSAAGVAMDATEAGEFVVIPATSSVDAAIAALHDDPQDGSLVHDLALNHVATKARRWTGGPGD